MTRHHGAQLIGGGLLALVLALGTAACGSDSDSGSPADPTSAAGATPGTSAPSDSGSSASDSGSTDGGDDAAAATCVKDSEYLSGTSTVVWTPDAKSKHQVAEVAADHKFVLTAADKLEPSTIEVGVDEVFSVTLAQDADGISVLKIGCDGGQTMTKGTEAGIYITAPGTYAVSAGLADDPAGTIVVK